VAVPPGETVVGSQRAQHRHAAGFQRLPQQDLVAVGADPVEHHSGHPHIRLEGGEAVDDGGDRCRHGRGVHHQHHGGVEQAGDIGGGRRGAVGGAVEEAHDPLHDEQAGPRRGPSGQGRDRLRPAQPGIEIARRPARGGGVVPRIDEIRTHLGPGRAVPGPPQGGQQAGGHGGLAHPRMGAADHEPGAEVLHADEATLQSLLRRRDT
jgi:hypothetical protein